MIGDAYLGELHNLSFKSGYFCVWKKYPVIPTERQT